MDCSQTDKMYSHINEHRISAELLLKMVEIILPFRITVFLVNGLNSDSS